MRLLLALFLMVSGSVLADPLDGANLRTEENPDGSVTIYLTTEQTQACRELGGCRVVTGDAMWQALEEMAERGYAQGKSECGTKGIYNRSF